MPNLSGPFIGSEALASGALSRDQLRRRYTRVHPDVYLPSHMGEPTLTDRIEAAWLWSGREGIVAGVAAAAMHGALWVDRKAPIELIHRNPRPPSGVVSRRDLVLSSEIITIDELAVTSAARTGFDLGRRGRLAVAVARVDALMRATGVNAGDMAAVAARHRHTRGIRQLDKVLELADPGAQSPKESWLRLVLVEAGLPRPQTQIPVADDDGIVFAYLDLGWADMKVAVEYDGDHHRTDRDQYVKDIRRREKLEAMGWIIITVVAGDRAPLIVARVRNALDRRLSVR